MRRVLFIAYLYPPIANSGTRRSLSFVNHLPDCGWNPLVLTVADPPERVRDTRLLDEIRPGTEIVRTPLSTHAWTRALSNRVARAADRKRVADGLAWRLDRLLAVPDEVAPWYPSAVRRGVALHRDLGFDLVYASGWPWTAFLAARAIGLRTGCPYVLDYRDLWKPTGTHAWEGQSRAQAIFNPWLERFAARRAAAVITVTPTLVDVIRENARVPKVHCITNGFEPTDFGSDWQVSTSTSGSAVRISYTGVWRPGYGLEDLYRAIRRLKDEGSPHVGRLRVDAAGFKPGPAAEFGVDDLVHESGPVDHERALAMMGAADALYLPVPVGFYARASLPGKLFEYLGSGKPLIAVVPDESEVARVTRDVGRSVRIEPGDVAALAQVIDRLCAGESDSLFGPCRTGSLTAYTRASTTRELAAIFDQVVDGRARI